MQFKKLTAIWNEYILLSEEGNAHIHELGGSIWLCELQPLEELPLHRVT